MKIQYYTSKKLILRRETAKNARDITHGGVIKNFNGRLIEEIHIKSKTPCVAVNVSKEQEFITSLRISFVPGDDANYLLFGVPENGPSDLDSKYEVLAKDWTDGIGTVLYDGKEWKVDASTEVILLVKEEDINQLKKRKLFLPGRRLEPAQ